MAAFSGPAYLTWTGTTNVANVTQAFYDSLWGYNQGYEKIGRALSSLAHALAPPPSPRDRDRLALALVRTRPAPTRAALRPRCALLTLAPRRTIVVRGTVSWTRQGGRRPLRCRSCR
jgi:hypothetical protein